MSPCAFNGSLHGIGVHSLHEDGVALQAETGAYVSSCMLYVSTNCNRIFVYNTTIKDLCTSPLALWLPGLFVVL